MLFRIVTIPKRDDGTTTYRTHIVCTKCGHKNRGSSFKTDALVSMTLLKCAGCDEVLNNQELLNKKVATRLEYHESK